MDHRPRGNYKDNNRGSQRYRQPGTGSYREPEYYRGPHHSHSESYNFSERQKSRPKPFRGSHGRFYPYEYNDRKQDAREKLNESRRSSWTNYQDRGTEYSSFRPYQSRRPGQINRSRGAPYCNRRSENDRVLEDCQPAPTRSDRSQDRSQSFSDGRNLNEGELQHVNDDSNCIEERDSLISKNNRTFEAALVNEAQNQSFASTNQNETCNTEIQSSTSKSNLKRKNENVENEQDNVMSKQSRLLNHENAIIKQRGPIDKQSIVNQNELINEKEAIPTQRSENEEIVEKHNAEEYDSHIVNDEKAENSTNEKMHNCKKINNDSAMQLKLFLLECKKKLRDGFKVFYKSKVKNANEVTDAIFSFEKVNSLNIFKVNYHHQEFKHTRLSKKLNYRTLISPEFGLDKMFTVFKENKDIDRVVIYSNLELDEPSLIRKNIRVIEDKSRGTHHIKVNDSDVLKKMIEKHSRIQKLAQHLYECMWKVTTGKHLVLKGVMKEYHSVLLTEKVITITGNKGRKQIGEFHPDFIKNPDNMLKPPIVQLRQYLKSFNGGELRTDGKLVLSENFGKASNSQLSQTENLLPEFAIEDTVKKFFDKLEFMKCEKNLDYYMHQELGKNFELIQSDSHKEVVEEELFTRLKPDSDQTDLFQVIERKILSYDLNNYLNNYQQKKEVRLEFESDTLQNLEAILTQTNKSIIIIKSDYPSLCALKMKQVVKNLKKYKNQYFFLDGKELLHAKDNILAVLSTQLEQLFVIQTEQADLKSEQLNDCLKDIKHIISNDPKGTNKIVLIQNISDSFNFSTDNAEFEEIFNHKAGLTTIFQDKLSETLCETCGPVDVTHTATLNKLFLDPCDMKDLLASAQCVDKLVNAKLVIGENLLKPFIFESTYTRCKCIIPRRLKRHVVVNSAALNEISEAFFIVGDEKESKVNNVHYFKDFNSALSSFEQFTCKNRKINAHMLKHESTRDSNQLIWQRSNGSVSLLMKYLLENTQAVYQSDPIDVLDRRIMILSGKSGSGKSQYLFELANRLKSSNQNLEHWVIQLNLNNSLLEQHIDSQISNAEEAVNLLTKILGFDELHQRLFHLSAFDKLKLKLSLFVDGLENLRKNNANLVYKILRLLCKTKIKRIYVTARPEFKKILEQELDDFAYSLESLTQEEQKTFLASTLSSLANEVFTEQDQNNYQDEIYNVCNQLDITIEPLYLHMFAIVFWKFVKEGQNTIPQICDIYREYLDKFENDLELSRKKIFVESFSFLSLKSLLHPDDFRKLKLYEVRSSEDFAKLNHSSFAEYGAAKWLASLPLREQIEAFNVMEDLAERVSLVFFETFALSCDKSYTEHIKQIGDNRLLVKLFTDHLWDNASDCRKQKILEEAVQSNRVKLASELMSRSMEIQLPAYSLMRVTAYVIDTLVKDKPTKSHPYWFLIEKLLLHVPQAAVRIHWEAQLQLLAGLFARGSYEAVSKIFQSIGDHEKKERILRTPVDGLKPLEIVNSSALLTDERRLGISKFLIERNGSNKNVYSVMRVAARHGHVQCFEFFAGKSLEMRSNFLKNALKSNQLDVLQFLHNDSERTRGCDTLHTAVAEGVSPKTLEFLLSHGGVDKRNSKGETALCVAFKGGVDLRYIKLLLEKGADVNAKDEEGLHAWCYAVLKEWSSYNPQQQLELMRFLKNKKYNLIPPQPDDYPLIRRINEIKRKLEYLWDPENYDLDDYNGTPRLHIALSEKDYDWFEFLLQHGADPDALDSQNRMALHLAVKLEKGRDVLDTVRLLLRYGATFNALDPDGKTPLDLIGSSEDARDEKGSAYKLLRQVTDIFTDEKSIEQLKKELNVKDTKIAKTTHLYWMLHSRDRDGRTLLHRAAERNLQLDYFTKLLRFYERFGNKECGNGLWLDTRDNLGETVVHVVARLNNYKVLRELARKGASLTMENSKGEIPLSSDPECKEFLETANQMFSGAWNGSLETLRGIDLVKTRDKHGCTLLHIAALAKSSAVSILLHEWNANPNVVDLEGRTPLHFALIKNDLESAKMLVKAGAKVDVRDKNGKQPTDVKEQGRKSVQMISILNEMLERCWRAKLSATDLDDKVEALKRNFDLEPSVAVNARDSAGNTMAHYAAHNHEPELLKALLRHGAEYNARNASYRLPEDLADGETKDLLSTVHNMFQYPNVASWQKKEAVLGSEIMTRCRKSGGYTLLHTVLEAKKVEEAKWLIEKGADVNVTNNVGTEARKLAKDLQLIVE